MATKMIKIQVDEDTREVTVSPTGVYVNPRDTLQWEVLQADSFVLTFDDARICEHGHEIVGRNHQAQITVGDRRGIFHYQVAMSVKDKVYVLSGCPSVHNG